MDEAVSFLLLQEIKTTVVTKIIKRENNFLMMFDLVDD
jgi:hypothetical protein